MIRPPRYQSIRNKIVLGLLLIVFSILLPVEIFEYFQLKQQAQTGLEQLNTQKLQRLSENLELPLWELDKAWVEKVILSEMDVKSIFAITVDSEGKWFAGKARNKDWRPMSIETPINGLFKHTARRIFRNGEHIGDVHLYITTKFYDRELIQAIAIELSKALLLALLLIASLRVLLTRIIISPLESMLGVIREIADGNYKHTILGAEQNDEIGMMAMAMQRMTENLKQASQAAIAVAEGDYTHKLEIRGPNDLFALSMNRMTDSLDEVVKQIDIISQGNYKTNFKPRSKFDTLGIATERMVTALAEFNQQHQEQIWLQQSIVTIADAIRNEETIDDLANHLIQNLCLILDAKIGLLFLVRQENLESILYPAGSYASPVLPENSFREYRLGEGLIGQVAIDRQNLVLNSVTEENIRIQSGLIDFAPQSVVLSPFSFNTEIRGVIELGFTNSVTSVQQELLIQTQEAIANAFERIYNKNKLSSALKQAQIFSKGLQISNEALLKKTEELQQQTIELRESERINIERARELEESNRYKSEFLANMSHELRTPLNSLLILAKLLAENENGNLSEEQVESVTVIQNSGQHLLQLINEILDLSKAEAGRMTAKPSRIAFTQLQHVLHQRFTPLTKEKQLHFNIELSKDLPAYFISDRKKLEQILTNLLGNAVKFTHHGSISLTISRYQQDSVDWVRFDVTDTGVGIPDEQLTKIFNSFHQVDGSFSRSYGGTGLGLSIALAYAVLLGGRIDVHSKEAEGSSFSLLLPMHWLNSETSQELQNSEPESEIEKNQTDIAPSITSSVTSELKTENNAELANKSLMIVDDNMRNSYSLASSLRNIGMQVMIADSCEEAIAQLSENQAIDFVLMDLMLLEKEGFDAIQSIRAHDQFTNLPIIVTAPKSASHEINYYLEMGANHYLIKPVDLNDLVAILKKWL